METRAVQLQNFHHRLIGDYQLVESIVTKRQFYKFKYTVKHLMLEGIFTIVWIKS